jgi:ABC-2 type transport system permease protein
MASDEEEDCLTMKTPNTAGHGEPVEPGVPAVKPFDRLRANGFEAMVESFISFLARFRALSRKEFLSVWNDPSGRAILFVPILIDALQFGYVATFDLSKVPYAVLDQNRSPTSISLLAHLDGTGFFRRVATLETAADIERVVNTQKALMVVRIGPRFEEQLLAGANEPIQIILDARNSTTANSAVAYVNAIVDSFNSEQRQLHGGGEPMLVMETRAWFNPNLLSRWNFVPALIALLSGMQTLFLTALSVAREREQGTFDQLLVTPLTSTEVMIGKSIVPMLIGRFWYEIPLVGSLLTLYAGVSIFVLAIVGMGLSVSAVAANMQQAMLYSLGLMIPMVLLSGFMTPVASMSRAVQIGTQLNPMRHGIDFVRRVYLEGAGLGTLTADLVPLLLIAVVTLTMAAWLFRNRMV